MLCGLLYLHYRDSDADTKIAVAAHVINNFAEVLDKRMSEGTDFPSVALALQQPQNRAGSGLQILYIPLAVGTDLALGRAGLLVADMGADAAPDCRFQYLLLVMPNSDHPEPLKAICGMTMLRKLQNGYYLSGIRRSSWGDMLLLIENLRTLRN